MFTATAELQQIAEVLNSDTRRKKQLVHRSLEREKSEYQVLRNLQQSSAINLVNLYYKHAVPKHEAALANRGVMSDDSESALSVGPITVIIQQGQLMAITGTAHGKTTLLMLIAKMLLPTSGVVSYPAHLSVRFVSREPLLLNDSFIKNLRVGMDPVRPKFDENQSLELCRQLGLSEQWLRRPQKKVGRDGKRMRPSDRILLCVARVLLAGTDVLLLGGCLDSLGHRAAEKVLGVLRKWVKNRALEDLSHGDSTNTKRETTVAERKRKTVLYVTNKKQLEEVADATLYMNHSGVLTAPPSSRLGQLAMSTDVSRDDDSPRAGGRNGGNGNTTVVLEV